MYWLNYCIYSITFVTFHIASAQAIDTHLEIQIRSNRIGTDWPLEKDLPKYLNSIRNVVSFCNKNKDDISIHLAFGLFLTNVNLGHALLKKARSIPVNVKNKIESIINGNFKLLKYFKKSAVEQNEGSLTDRVGLDLLSLFNNASYWVGRMERLVYTEQTIHSDNMLKEMYSPFDDYMEKVVNPFSWVPTPIHSDICLVSLSRNPRNMKHSTKRCVIADLCYDVVEHGSNFGYSLSHRIVILMMAHFGRGCNVFSPKEDKKMIQKFCSMAYAEAEYIVRNNYGHIDLLMEIISLCSVEGHAQFFRRAWLNNMLDFQTSDGCFATMPVTNSKVTRLFSQLKNDNSSNSLVNKCNGHTTGLAAAMFSSAVRFIIEGYY